MELDYFVTAMRGPASHIFNIITFANLELSGIK